MNRCGATPAPKPSGAPNLAGFQRPQRPPSHVYQMMTTEEEKEAHDVVTCTFFVNLLPARVLFDSSSDRSFMLESFKINNEKFLIDLIPMPMGEIDVFIGMDWLSKYDAIISCQNKLIRIRTLSRRETFIYGERKKTSLAICTYARAKRHLVRGCQAYLVDIIDTQKSTPCLDNIPVVWEFHDVSPEELLGIPPKRQVEFCIDLIPGSTPIAKTPYRLALSEMQELMKQLQELLDKGFIRLSSSPNEKRYSKPLEIHVWKWEKITMDLITKFPKTPRQCDAIWVIVDHLTKSAIFLPIKESMSSEALAELYLHEVVARHRVPVSIVSDRDNRFTSRFWQRFQEDLASTLSTASYS
ncbi:reverse transcriptase domain-containing protein [Tanacetum coccineum]